jgi:hypothetical protein
VVAVVLVDFLREVLLLLLAQVVLVVEEMGQIALLVQTAQQILEGAVVVVVILILVVVALAAQAALALSFSNITSHRRLYLVLQEVAYGNARPV